MQLRMLASQVAALDVHFWYVAKHVSTYETSTFCVHVPLQLQSCGQPLVLGHVSWTTGANDGLCVGASVPAHGVPAAVGPTVGVSVGVKVFAHDGYAVGTDVGTEVGSAVVGSYVGVCVGENDGSSVVGGLVVGTEVG